MRNNKVNYKTFDINNEDNIKKRKEEEKKKELLTLQRQNQPLNKIQIVTNTR